MDVKYEGFQSCAPCMEYALTANPSTPNPHASTSTVFSRSFTTKCFKKLCDLNTSKDVFRKFNKFLFYFTHVMDYILQPKIHLIRSNNLARNHTIFTTLYPLFGIDLDRTCLQTHIDSLVLLEVLQNLRHFRKKQQHLNEPLSMYWK